MPPKKTAAAKKKAAPVAAKKVAETPALALNPEVIAADIVQIPVQKAPVPPEVIV